MGIRRTGDRGRRTGGKDRGRKTEDGGRETEDRGRRTLADQFYFNPNIQIFPCPISRERGSMVGNG